ncbi:uncharacterized protein N0V89_003142 [Didymosphaeria variabile]|uniref:Uncharacterized protein n=1 Tax=Didymosphaeria variabile TaxID=1932322 RepID=A0A9W8XUT7_9PLEO|nr:uncharacterized protein N0V89_003142 [Didymosphaeria variabile]KAJ4358558.1 hypothetical protein N0V89_003142 [Didymosphaeria variabile]
MSELENLDNDFETYVHNFGEPQPTVEKLEDIAAKSLSHDGSSSGHSLTERTTTQAANPSAHVGVEEGYYSIEVPDHVDWRGGYGRRKTQDFGFPGARIKPGSTFMAYKKPLQDRNNWIKRACGHFSTISAIEPREEAARKPCSQCRAAAPPLPMTPKHHHSRRRAASDSSTGSAQSFRKDSRCRRQHHSACVSGDKRGDTFTQDLGYAIDSILGEHQNTLQKIINNIKISRPNLAQHRQVSEDPQPPCPQISPRAAEKLNVGAPGQLGPNMNDALPWLLDSVKSGPELVNLVNSAADDLGIDLDLKYTAEDDAKFEAAPVECSPECSPERSPEPSTMSRHSSVVEPVVEKFDEEEFHAPDLRTATILESEKTQETEDAWLQKARKQLTQLSETRSQLMDELDVIADDLGIHLDDRRRSSTFIDPVERALSKVNNNLFRKSTRLRNKSVDFVIEKVPRMIDQGVNERRLSKVLTRISTQSRRMSIILQGRLEVEAIPLEKIQAWLECAQNELPAAIDCITAVMESLPVVDLAPRLETEAVEASRDAEEQPEVVVNVATQRQTDHLREVEEQSQYAVDFSPELRSEEVEYREERPESPISLALEPDISEIEETAQAEEQPIYAFDIVTGLGTPELEPELDYFQPPVVHEMTARRSIEQYPSPEPEPEIDYQARIVRNVTIKQCTESTPELEVDDFRVPVVLITRRAAGLERKATYIPTTALENKEVPSPQRAATSRRILEQQLTPSPEELMEERVATRQPNELETEQAPPEEEEEEEEEEPLSRRASTAISRQSTYDQPTEVERKATRVPSERAPPVEEELVERLATGISCKGPPDRPPAGLIQKNVEPELGADRISSPSTQSSVLNEPLAVLDVYHGHPAPSILDSPQEPIRAPARNERIRSRRQLTVGDVPLDEKTVRIQDEPTAFYTPPAICSRQPSISTPERQPTAPPHEAEHAPNETLAAPVIRIAERRTVLAEEILDQESGRLDRPLTAELSRHPQSFEPPLERVATAVPRKQRNTIPRVLAVSVEKQRKPSSAAPGIFAPPTQYAPKKMTPTARKGKSKIPVYGVNLPPDQQRPPAPEYPVRDTPTWTKPDTHTPPPKPKEEPPTKSKPGFFRFGSKPKADPRPVSRVQREYSPEPPAQRDREPVQPFRSAAPGSTPGYPGGTLQRPKGNKTAPERDPISPARNVAPPVPVYSPPRRRDDLLPQQTTTSARKDDYYLRLPPLLPSRRGSCSRPGSAHVRGDVCSQPPPAPARRHVYSQPPPGPVLRDFYQPPSPSALVRRKSYAKPPSPRHESPPPVYRQRPSRQDYAPRNEVNARPLRSQAPKFLRYQPQTQQHLRDKEKAASRREAPPHVRRASTDKQPTRPLSVPQEATKPEPVRQDARRGRTRSRTLEMLVQKAPSTQSGNIGRQPSSSATRGSQAPQAEECSQENFGPAVSEFDPREGDGDLGLRQITDGTTEESSRPSIKKKAYTERNATARTTPPRASTFSALDAARRISAAGHALKLNPDDALLKPLSPVEAARTISAAGHRIKSRSSRSPEGFRSGSTTVRAGTSRAGTPRTGTLRGQSKGSSVAPTAEKFSRATIGGHVSRRASAVGEEARKTRKITGRHPSTAHGARSPRTQQSRWRSASDATRAMGFSGSSVGGTTRGPSGPGNPLSEASSARVTPKSFSRDGGPEQYVQKIRTISEAVMDSPRTPIQQHRGPSVLSRETSRADVPRSQSSVRSLPVPEPAAADDSWLQPPEQQRADAKRRQIFLAASPAPWTDSPTRQKSFWGRRNKSESPPPRDRKNAGAGDEPRGYARDGSTGGTGQTGEDGGGQRKGYGEKEKVGANVAAGQGMGLGLRRRLFEKWA